MKLCLRMANLLVCAATLAPTLAGATELIRFGTGDSYPPFHSRTADGRLVGFDIDLGNEICRRLNARCQWVENEFDSMIPALKARKFDAILSSLAVTPQRQQQIDFSAKIYNTPSWLIARKGSVLQATAAALRGKRVGVEQGTIQQQYAEAHWARHGVQVVVYQNQPQVYLDLVSGRLDAALQNAVSAQTAFLSRPEGRAFAFVGQRLNDPQLLGPGAAIGLRKGDSKLKAEINRAIADMRQDGSYQKIQARYFPFDVY